MVDCPTCGCDCDTERGMKIHHKKAHGESLAGVSVSCSHCGSELSRKHTEVEARENFFCHDKDCRSKFLTGRNTKEDNPNWQNGETVIECEVCGEERYKKNLDVERTDHDFCSMECQGVWQSNVRVGDNHPLYKGGPQGYGSGWNEAKKRAVRERDDYQCQRCGIKQQDHIERYGRRLDVHHIVPARKFDDAQERNRMDNLITFCMSCHRRWEGIPLKPQNHEY